MRLGAVDLQAIIQKARPCSAPVASAAWQDWNAQQNELLAMADDFSSGFTEHRFTAKYEMMRSAIALHRAREPLTRCRIDTQKAGRNISDYQAINEIRAPHFKEAKAWEDRATNAERNKNIKVGAIIATIATMGAAAFAAAGAAGGITTAAGLKAAAASVVGAAPGASVGKIALAGAKKLAIKYGTEAAAKYAVEEYAKHQQKKMTKQQEKALLAELEAAQREYDSLVARGVDPAKAEAAASRSGGGGGIFPLGLAVLALKYL